MSSSSARVPGWGDRPDCRTPSELLAWFSRQTAPWIDRLFLDRCAVVDGLNTMSTRIDIPPSEEEDRVKAVMLLGNAIHQVHNWFDVHCTHDRPPRPALPVPENTLMTEVSAIKQLLGAQTNAAPKEPAEGSTPSPDRAPDGPEPPHYFWWKERRYDFSDMQPAVWRLLTVLWGKPVVSVADIGKALGKSRRFSYESLKPTVTRLNTALLENKLPFSWSKKRRENLLIYNGPSPDSSVSE